MPSVDNAFISVRDMDVSLEASFIEIRRGCMSRDMINPQNSWSGLVTEN
jgi:hypothetical protein